MPLGLLILSFGLVILLVGIFVGSVKKMYTVAWKICLVAGVIQICGFIINIFGINL